MARLGIFTPWESANATNQRTPSSLLPKKADSSTFLSTPVAVPEPFGGLPAASSPQSTGWVNSGVSRYVSASGVLQSASCTVFIVPRITFTKALPLPVGLFLHWKKDVSGHPSAFGNTYFMRCIKQYLQLARFPFQNI